MIETMLGRAVYDNVGQVPGTQNGQNYSHYLMLHYSHLFIQAFEVLV